MAFGSRRLKKTSSSDGRSNAPNYEHEYPSFEQNDADPLAFEPHDALDAVGGSLSGRHGLSPALVDSGRLFDTAGDLNGDLGESDPGATETTEVTHDGIIVVPSAMLCAITQRTADDLIGTRLHMLVAEPADQATIDRLLQSALDGSSSQREIQILSGTGSTWVSFSGWRQRLSPTSSIMLMVEPVQGRARIEDPVEAIIDRSPSGMARIDANLNCRYVNNRWTEITGQPIAGAFGHGWLDMIDLEGRSDFVSALRDSLAEGKGLRGRLRLVTSAGDFRWVELVTTPVGGHGAGINEVVASFADITDDLEAARRAEELTRVLEATPDLVAMLDRKGHRILWANDAFRKFLGGQINPQLANHFDAHSQTRWDANALPSIARNDSWQGELTLTNGVGEETPVSVVLVAHRDPNEDIENLSFIARDLTDLRNAERKVRATEVRLAALVEHASDLVALLDRAGRVIYTSPAVTRVLGYASGSLDGTILPEVIHPDDVERAIAIAQNVLEVPNRTARIQCRVARSDETWRHLEVVVTNLLDNPAIGGVVLNARDVTDRVEAAAELEERAYHDALTGLPNRALLLQRVQEALDRASTQNRLVAVLFLDLDRFKVVNDSLGHAAGDELLIEVARRLNQVVRDSDTVARLGGDEFVVVINIEDKEESVLAADRFRKEIAAPIMLGSESMVVTTSIGIAVSDGSDEPADLLRDADTALYRAKETGRDRADEFDDQLRTRAVNRLDMERRLRAALDPDGPGAILVHYQPIIELASGRVIGAEALVRLRDDDGQVRRPSEFVDVAEETGLISQLGRSVLGSAARQLTLWDARGQSPLTISVNVSPRQLADPRFASLVAADLIAIGLEPERMTLELTESALIDANPVTEKVLAELTELGVCIGLDDFGTGFSSLAYLKRFPITFVKIDQSFVDGLGTEDDDTAIVRAIIALAHSLGLLVTAEGVETATQLRLLQQLGCDRAQGNLLGETVGVTSFDPLPRRLIDLTSPVPIRQV